MKRPKIDFRAVLERTTIMGVAETLALQLKKEGAGFRCACPAHPRADARSLSITPDIGFRCFAVEERGDRGDQIQLYAHVKQISNYEAAEQLLRIISPPEAKPATSPAQAVDGGRTDLAEMLGISPAALQALGATEGDRLVIPLRTTDGTQIGTLGIATRADQAPLLSFAFDEKATMATKPQPDDLRKLFRVVS